jgi:hypothetical protein
MADVDNDGDADVLSGTAWYENTDGQGSFGRAKRITGASEGIVYAVDIDGDHDMDMLSASCRWVPTVSKVTWYEDADGEETFGEPQSIASKTYETSVWPMFTFCAQRVYTADLDGDGDADVLVESVSGAETGGRMAWHENTDGVGGFGEQQVIATGSSFDAADVDGDGDVDILSSYVNDYYHDGVSVHIAWYEQLPGDAGDANLDNQFDQTDITAVLGAGKYRTGEPATWQEGDWNHDGVFDQLDIIAALQTGSYLQGPYAARAADSVFADSGT